MATLKTMRGRTRRTAPPPGLQAANFRKIAPNGLGDPHNTYPHAMTWFGGRLYVSTTRDNLVFPKLRYPFEIPLSCWPVRLPQDLWDLDLRAQIWRYDPAADRWSMVHAAPLERGREGRQVPSCIAYRAMAVFRSRHDSAAALYAPTFAPLPLGRGSAIVRSYDGEEYEVGPEPGLAVGNGRFRSFRTLKAFGDRLFTAPTMGDAVGRPNQAGVAVVLVTTDPFRDGWRVANEPSFGDPGNLTVFDLAVCAGRLYAGTMNVQRGFQVWKTDAEGPPPFRWVKVLDRGAGRGQFNQGAITMVPFGGSLYIAAAVQNGGFDRVHGIGPVAAELLRLHPDDTWDLIAGEPRLTEQGLKPPLSGMGSGFNNPFAGYFWQMCEHDGWLYLGTFDSSAFLPFHPMEKAPAPFRNALETIGVETFLNRFGGFDLWRTRDGVRWTRVTSNGFGNPYNYGVRTMASTPHGLFLGATNPFGPEVAVRRAGGWVYEANPRGGLEIWLGRPPAAGDAPVEGDVAGAAAPVAAPPGAAEEGGGAPAPPPPFAVSSGPALTERLVREYYGMSGFRHVGYWREQTREARQACEELLRELLSLLPDRDGPILEIGCGIGATTAALFRHFPPEAVTGVALQEEMLEFCRANAPDARFVAGLPWLPLADRSFSSALCMEALAGRGDLPEALREIHRVLRPGGWLAIADLLYVDGPVADPQAYEGLLLAAGFTAPRVIDTTLEGWTRFQAHSEEYLWKSLLSGTCDLETFRELRAALPGADGLVTYSLIAAARRPEEPA